MKRFAYYIACCSLVALFSCTHDDVDGSLVSAGDGKITIQSTLDDMIITRAADNKPERTITHIDVFAVDKNGAIVYYERDKTGNNSDNDQGKGKLTLGVARQAKKADGSFYFAQGEEYSFVLVANAVADEDAMQAITSLDELELAVQDDSFETNFGEAEGSSSVDPSMSRQTLLHLTGTKQGTNEDHPIPEVFLMDAVATDSKGNTKWVVNSTSDKGNLDLSAEFKRAASKIIVNITQGEDVEFHTELDKENTQYDFYKLPASTFVLPNQSKLVGLQLINTAPMGPNDETFIWAADGAAANNIQVIGYAYSHSWSDVDLANETSLILNIPMMWNKDNDANHTKEAAAPRSWYKVPLSQGKKFERNKCYIVNVKINAVGAQSRSTAIKLEDIEYVTLDWVDVPISVGNSEERPKYLILNTDLVEMYNVNFDNTSLSFSSSSAITSVKLKDIYTQNANGTFTVAADSHSAYYINKFGIPTDLSATVRNTISATPEWDVLNGNISILSPILKTTPEERKLAMAALGEQPEEPTEVAAPSGMPEPKLPSSTSSSSTKEENVNFNGYNITLDVKTTTTTSYSYEGVGENIKFYKTTTVNKTYQGWGGGTNNVDGYPQTTTEEYVDEDLKNTYVTVYNAWVADNAENVLKYQQYLEAKAKYDAYNTAKTAIENSGNATESHYNTIRYLEFEVTNADGLTATFRVMQYPVIYITNQQGWYSYRDDFNSHYQYKGDRYVSIALSTNNNGTWNGGYSYSRSAGSRDYFWHSKVVSSYDENTGKSTTSFYSWSQNSTASTASVGNDATCETDANARMYHVRVTATSKDYTIGRPRLDSNGFTLGDAANSKLVSPSFMIASRLGAIYSSYGGLSYVEDGEDNDNDGVADRLEIFREHCKQYVEVYKDANGNPVKFDDWRLPTEKEIEIIISLQGTEDQDAPAIDYLLNGYYYMSASGPVYNSKGDNDNTNTSAIRCVRDAY
ncbi:MAG: hypothetical protein IKM69_03825 [Alistipes sp.]|nr:hypothetical protein [Alistipes sp.]